MESDGSKNLDTAIGRRLTQLRETSGLTRTELAIKSGISLSEIIAHEDGTLRLGARHMFKICTIFGVKPADLLGGIQEDGRDGRSLHDSNESFEP